MIRVIGRCKGLWLRGAYLFTQESKLDNSSCGSTNEHRNQKKPNSGPFSQPLRSAVYLSMAALTSVLGYQIFQVSQAGNPTGTPTGTPTDTPSLAAFIYSYYSSLRQYLSRPPVAKFLPDLPSAPSTRHPKTLVIGLSGVLVSREQGKKRPGLQMFLKRVSQYYEVVVFDEAELGQLSARVIEIDPRRTMVVDWFGGDCLVYSRGAYVKDLGYLNRDLSGVVAVDLSRKKVSKQPQNVVELQEYRGDDEDRQLMRLAALLEYLARPTIKDVREALSQMGEDPLAYFQKEIQPLYSRKARQRPHKQPNILGRFMNKIQK